MPTSRPIIRATASHFRVAAAAVAILVTAALAVLGWQQWSSEQSEGESVLRRTEDRAGQLAASGAGRVGAIVRSADFVLLAARSLYEESEPMFLSLVDRIRASFPEAPGLLLQLSVAAADGRLVYSTLGPTRSINVADRDAFRAHLGGDDRMHVSVPVVGRISGLESILFTRPLLRGGRFAGTVALSLSLQQLGALLATLDTASYAELALLGHGDAVLALSSGARRAALLGKSLQGVEGLSAAPARGALRAGVFGDGAARVVARRNVAGTDLAVVAALDWNAAQEPLTQRVRRARNITFAFGAALLLLGAGVIAVLLRMSEQQQAVAANEARFRDLADRLQIGQITARMVVMDWHIAENRLEWSDSPEWLRGPLPAETGRYPPWEVQVHPDDRECFVATGARSIATLQGAVLEYRFVRTDGELLWLRSHQKVIAGPDGKAARMVVALLDITGQKAAEEQLRLSEAQLAEAQRLAQIGSWELDIARNLLTWSDEIYRIFEIDRAHFGASYEAFLGLVHPEDRDAVDRAYTRSLENREPYRIVHRLHMADGRIKYVEERCETDFAPDGTALRSRGTVQDITERRLAERALRESEATLAGMIHTAMDAIITIDERQKILSFNPAAERIFGYPAADILERPVEILLPERLRDHHEELIERFSQSCEIRRSMGGAGNIVGLRRDGSEIHLEATIARVETGDRLRFSVMMRDVTERRRTEQRVREQARLLDLIFRHSIDCIVLLDRDFNFLRVSASYARACQRDIAEFKGRNHFDLYPSSFREEAERARDAKTIYQREARPFVFLDHPDWGTTYWDIALVPILAQGGEVELLLLTLKDVSKQVRISTALRESAARLRKLSGRLRQVEERERRAMARELHDRIGQNLSTLNLELGMLGQQIAAGRVDDADEQLAEMQQTLRTVIGHARDLMGELRPPALEDYGLLAALQDLAADFGRKTRVAARVEGSPLQQRPSETIEIAMYRIAQEALNNSAKHAGARQVRLILASSDDAIELAVSDDGVGFDTSQPENGDPTWGLTTMRERAEEAGIDLTIDSAPGRGTRVTLRVARPA